MQLQRCIGATLLVMAAALPAQAEAQSRLDAASAQAIVDGCAAHAEGRGQSHGIVVVDGGGHLVAARRMDGNGHGIMAFAGDKARASAAWGGRTSQLAQGAANTPGFGDAPYVVTVPGGVPVFDAEGQNLLGGVGVSGEPPMDDEACAVAGIEAAGLAASRVRR